MKKLIIRILTFVPVAAISYVLLLWVLGDWGWVRTGVTTMGEAGHLNSRVKDIRNYHDIDLLFLGSSHCYRTFDTRYFEENGYHCFNLGSSNQTPMQTYVLLSQYLDSLNPKYVVFEVHPDIMRNDGIESGVNLLANVPLTKESTAMAFKLKNMKVLNTWLYATYNQLICHRLERFNEDTVIDFLTYIPGGYCDSDTTMFERKNYPRTKLTIRPEQMEALQKCLAMLKERDIPFLLVEIQDSYQLRKSYTNHPWFEAQLAALGPYRYEVLPMVDTLHFFNSNHLSKSGAVIYNHFLLSILNEQFPNQKRCQ